MKVTSFKEIKNMDVNECRQYLHRFTDESSPDRRWN